MRLSTNPGYDSFTSEALAQIPEVKLTLDNANYGSQLPCDQISYGHALMGIFCMYPSCCPTARVIDGTNVLYN
jgi:hypothetical protein